MSSIVVGSINALSNSRTALLRAECDARDADLATLRGRVKVMEVALRQIIDVCGENIDCTHQDADDGSDDCVGCFIVMIADDALAPPEEVSRG